VGAVGLSRSGNVPARRGANGVGKGPARGYSWPPFAEGHTLSLKHGLFSEKLRPGDAAEIEELAAMLRGLVPLYAGSFDVAVELLAARLWRLRRAYAFVAATSEADLPRNFSEKLASLELLVNRTLKELGLTPAAAAELGVNLSRLSAASEVDGPAFNWDSLEEQEKRELSRLLAKGRRGDGD
jgi:hypothetical protein